MNRVDRNGKDMPEAPFRRDLIWKNYRDAWNAGDRNVYFVDGNSFFAYPDRDACTVDCGHPNDLGMYRIAEKLYDAVVSILRIREMNS